MGPGQRLPLVSQWLQRVSSACMYQQQICPTSNAIPKQIEQILFRSQVWDADFEEFVVVANEENWNTIEHIGAKAKIRLAHKGQ